MINGVRQLVIAVKDLDEAVKAYEALGFKVERRAKSEALKLNQAFLYFGDGTEIELACPYDENSAVGKGLARNGEGLYMVSVTVDDVDAAAKQMKENGVQLIEGGGRVFVHPRATKGVLMRLDAKK